MGERGHELGGEFQILRLDQIEDAGLVLGQLGAPAILDGLEVGRTDQGLLPALARQQDAALLERLAHARDPERQFRVGQAGRAAGPRTEFGVAIGLLELAAGKYQSAGEGIDLMVPNHHEDFERRSGIASLRRPQQEDGGGGTRRCRFLLGRVIHDV